MGGRKLRAWILQPLRDLTELECRQQMIADLLQEPDLLASLRGSLKSIRDLERAAGRLSQASGNARDLVALKTSLQQIPKLKARAAKAARSARLRCKSRSLRRRKTQHRITRATSCKTKCSEMPALATKLTAQSWMISAVGLERKAEFFATVTMSILTSCGRRRATARIGSPNCRSARSRATGIKSLKVRFNSVFGYFIEITKSNLANVPAHYTRKQTTVGGERFITPELKEMEAKILGADERARKSRVSTFSKTARRNAARARTDSANGGRDRDCRC